MSRATAVFCWCCLLVSSLAFQGCGEEKPTEDVLVTYPVDGEILQNDGTPLANAMIEFRPLKDAKANGRSMVENGKFTLEMRYKRRVYQGVPEGDYEVNITLLGNTEAEQADPVIITLEKPVTISAQPHTDLKLTLPQSD